MIKVVSTFIELPEHPRPPEEYHKLGKQLIEAVRLGEWPLWCVQLPIEQCWMYRWFKDRKLHPTHSQGDNPRKNTLAYHIVQNQKIETLLLAAQMDERPEVDTFCWIDYGIFHVPGVTAAVIASFLERAQHEKAIAIPGCWGPDTPPNDSFPHWRFCGGVLVCPRKYLFELDTYVKTLTMRYITETNNVTWEVNYWAHLEKAFKLPLWWYQADHDASMFTAYPETRNAS